MFIGIEGIARKVTGAHIGVDGVARKVKKAYVGVDGVARLAWEAGGSSGGGESGPVLAYLYNGAGPMADINSVYTPELQKTYPYACIAYIGDFTYFLITSEPLNIVYQTAEESSSGEETVSACYTENEVNYIRYELSTDKETWRRIRQSSMQFHHIYIPIWSNADMKKYYSHYNRDTLETTYEATGMIGLEASEPVPVYI